tara:strand:+ start:5752 stop:6159 length:408 start_codon:yes stop_codon:yes gene_type:complete
LRFVAHKIIEIFNIAGTAERLMPSISKPGQPKMYDLLQMSYDKKDLGFYEKKGLKLRANSRQITCWELAIDLLTKMQKIEDRRLVWARAMRFNWSVLGRQFGCHRVTIKRRYKTIILDLECKLPKETIDRIDNLI